MLPHTNAPPRQVTFSKSHLYKGKNVFVSLSVYQKPSLLLWYSTIMILSSFKLTLEVCFENQLPLPSKINKYIYH